MEKLSKNAEKRSAFVRKVISENRLISDRISILNINGFSTDEKSMGSGGVGQIKEVSGCIRMQIGYGHGRNNYAFIAYL